jgi:3-dehydroquinate synthetase
VSGVDADRVLEAMGSDKKRTAGDARHRFVLLEDIGEPVRNVPVDEEEARGAIGAVVG